jgi:hypothetical protein
MMSPPPLITHTSALVSILRPHMNNNLHRKLHQVEEKSIVLVWQR